jgi:hypothetical protein
MVCHRSCPYVESSAKCAISGGIHKPIHKPALPIGCWPSQGHRRVDWHGRAWWESSSHAADGQLPTTPTRVALQRDTSFVQSLTVSLSFLVLHVAVLLAAPPSAH